MKQLRITALASILFIICLTDFIHAQTPGTIDPSFANNGVLILEPNTIGTDVANGMAVLPNDKIILAGSTETGFLLSDAALYRILPDGKVDSSFGINGVSIFDCGGNQDYVQALKVLPNGNMIIAGGVYDGFDDVDIFAARVTENGFLDPSFGNNGVTIIPNPVGSGEDIANALAIQPDGKIILAGGWAVPGTTDQHTTVMRLNENGSIDNSFGTNGIVNVTNSGFSNDVALGVLLLQDGSIMTTGYADILNQRIIVEKFNSSGALDPTFNADGIAIYDLTIGYDVAWAIKLHPNGKILIAGKIGIGGPVKSDFLLMSIMPNGAMDSNFGNSGIATKHLETSDAALDFMVEPSGKIVLAGTSGGSQLGDNDWAICRFNENGTVDSSFGTNGATLSEISSAFSEAHVVAMQSNGDLVVGGRAATIKNDYAVVRYYSDPIMATCATPANPVVSAVTSTSATLSWDSPGNESDFQVRYRSTNDQSWTKMSVSGTSITLTGLTPGLKYGWSVRTKCGVGNVSSFSANSKFMTSPQRLADEGMNMAIQLYPNPSTGNFQLSFNTGENMTATATIQIVNIFGQVVDSRNVKIVNGNLEEAFNFSGQLDSGTYFMRLSISDKMYSSRFILQ